MNYPELVQNTRTEADRFFGDKPEAWNLHLKIVILEHPEVNPARFAHDVRLYDLKRHLRRLKV